MLARGHITNAGAEQSVKDTLIHVVYLALDAVLRTGTSCSTMSLCFSSR